nr:uncharacterized protein LOC104090882 [Nicotiana tomentosiformis]
MSCLTLVPCYLIFLGFLLGAAVVEVYTEGSILFFFWFVVHLCATFSFTEICYSFGAYLGECAGISPRYLSSFQADEIYYGPLSGCVTGRSSNYSTLQLALLLDLKNMLHWDGYIIRWRGSSFSSYELQPWLDPVRPNEKGVPSLFTYMCDDFVGGLVLC